MDGSGEVSRAWCCFVQLAAWYGLRCWMFSDRVSIDIPEVDCMYGLKMLSENMLGGCWILCKSRCFVRAEVLCPTDGRRVMTE